MPAPASEPSDSEVFTFTAFNAPDGIFDSTLCLAQLTNSIRRSTRTLSNRLRSIKEDSEFVARVQHAYGLPVVANARAGEWYVDPVAPTSRGSVYFKSTDGHAGAHAFSLRRLNLGLVEVAAEADGALVVDSTRRGKRFPDALSKTIPVWIAVLNAVLFPLHALELYTTPLAVAPSEHARIVARLPEFVREFTALGLDLTALRAKLKKPLRPLFVTPSSPLPPEPPSFEAFMPLVLVTASKVVNGTGLEGEYIQGAGDDHEGWASASGLTPTLFWNHHHELLLQADNHELLLGMIARFAAIATSKGGGVTGSSNSSSNSSSKHVSLIKPTKNIFISSQAAAMTAAAAAGHDDDEDAFDVIVDCSEFPVTTTRPCTTTTATTATTTAAAAAAATASSTKVIRSFPLPVEGKRGGKILRQNIGMLLVDLQQDLFLRRRVVFVCATGDAVAPAVALVALCLYYSEQGQYLYDEAGRGRAAAAIDKALVKRRLAWISMARPTTNPSRNLLQAVNSVLMPGP